MVSATTPSITTRSTISSSNKPSSTGVLPAKCIFCDKGRRKIKGKLLYPGKCEKYETAINIRDPATILDDENIQLKVGNYEFGKREYLNKSQNRKKEITKRNSSNIENKAKSVAINEMVRYVNTSIIAGNKPEFLSNILERYK